MIQARRNKKQTTEVAEKYSVLLTIDYTTCLITSKNMPDSVAYAVAKALGEGEKKLKAIYKGMRALNPATAWDPKVTGLPLHPGAEKYYKGKGYVK